MDIEKVKEQFPGGVCVLVKDGLRYNGICFAGLQGLVKKYDKTTGVCVQLLINKSFKPHWWFLPDRLEFNTTPMVLSVTVEVIVECLGGRGKSAVAFTETKILLGALRHWVIATARAGPGQSVFIKAMTLNYGELLLMFRETNNRGINQWLEDNDTRVRRVQMMDIEDARLDAVSIKRPKIA